MRCGRCGVEVVARPDGQVFHADALPDGFEFHAAEPVDELPRQAPAGPSPSERQAAALERLADAAEKIVELLHRG